MHAVLAGLGPAARIAVATLFNSLWEAALLALVVALVLRLLPNVNATTRYAAWCVALAASLLLPVATALPQIAVQHQGKVQQQQSSTLRSGAAAEPEHHAAQRSVPVENAPAHSAPAHSAPVQSAPKQTTPAVHAQPPFRMPQRLHFALPQYVALAIFAVWCVTSLLLLVRLAVNLWKLERLKSDAMPLPIEYRERLERWGNADKGEREVRLCTCDDIEVPVAVGLFDSMILIPKHLLDSLTQNEIDQIILHELAHLRRADDWTNGLQRLIQALFFFNPAVLYIAQQMDVEREVACDDWVVNQTNEVRPYATCLTKMAEATAWPHRPLAAPGVFITRRGLSVRVERLLRGGRNARIGLSFGPAGATAAALIVLFFLLQTVAPSFAFTVGQDDMHHQTAAVSQSVKHATQTVYHTVRETVVAQATIAPAAAATPSAAPVKTPAKAQPKENDHTIVVPAQHIHMKARDIHVHVPAIDVDVPAQHVVMPSMPPIPKTHVIASMPDISKMVNDTVNKSMTHAFDEAKTGGFNCTGCDYSKQNLSGRNFSGQRLNGADFSHANLRNANFANSVLVGADFSNADLRGASFAHANLTGCDLSHAQIDGVNFNGVTMVGCDVDARSLAPAQAAALLHGCRTGCDFSGADLSGQDLRNIQITGIDLSHANLRNADLSGARLQGVDLSGARLDGARLNGTELTGCDFSGVDLRGVDLSNARITGSKMGGPDR